MTQMEKCKDCSTGKEKNDLWEYDGGKFYICHPCFLDRVQRMKEGRPAEPQPPPIVIIDDSLKCVSCRCGLTISKTYRIDTKPYCSDCAWKEHKKGTYKSFYPPEALESRIEKMVKGVDTKGKKWLIDENLRKKDRNMEAPDALTTLDILPKGSPDTDVIRKARELGLIIVTRDIRLTLNCAIRGQPVVFQDFHGNRHLIKREVEEDEV